LREALSEASAVEERLTLELQHRSMELETSRASVADTSLLHATIGELETDLQRRDEFKAAADESLVAPWRRAAADANETVASLETTVATLRTRLADAHREKRAVCDDAVGWYARHALFTFFLFFVRSFVRSFVYMFVIPFLCVYVNTACLQLI
jgi:hypothetical protein